MQSRTAFATLAILCLLAATAHAGLVGTNSYDLTGTTITIDGAETDWATSAGTFTSDTTGDSGGTGTFASHTDWSYVRLGNDISNGTPGYLYGFFSLPTMTVGTATYGFADAASRDGNVFYFDTNGATSGEYHSGIYADYRLRAISSSGSGTGTTSTRMYVQYWNGTSWSGDSTTNKFTKDIADGGLYGGDVGSAVVAGGYACTLEWQVSLAALFNQDATLPTSFLWCAGNTATTADVYPNADGDYFQYTIAGAAPTYHDGDANGDSWVDFTDLTTVLGSYNQSDKAWANGDFNADGWVDFTDLTTVLQYYNQSFGASASSRAVPEPSTLLLTVAGLVGLLAYAWRKRK